MFESVERSWNLAKESLGVIRKDPELMILPIASFRYPPSSSRVLWTATSDRSIDSIGSTTSGFLMAQSRLGISTFTRRGVIPGSTAR